MITEDSFTSEEIDSVSQVVMQPFVEVDGIPFLNYGLSASLPTSQ